MLEIVVCCFMLLPAPDYHDDPDSPYVLTLGKLVEADDREPPPNEQILPLEPYYEDEQEEPHEDEVRPKAPEGEQPWNYEGDNPV